MCSRSAANSIGQVVTDKLCVKPASVAHQRFEAPGVYQSRTFTITDIYQSWTIIKHGAYVYVELFMQYHIAASEDVRDNSLHKLRIHTCGYY